MQQRERTDDGVCPVRCVWVIWLCVCTAGAGFCLFMLCFGSLTEWFQHENFSVAFTLKVCTWRPIINCKALIAALKIHWTSSTSISTVHLWDSQWSLCTLKWYNAITYDFFSRRKFCQLIMCTDARCSKPWSHFWFFPLHVNHTLWTERICCKHMFGFADL